MCAPSIPGKPTAAQLAGFNGTGGSGVTITGYNPNYGVYQSVYDTYYKNIPGASNLFPDRGGTFTLSDGTTQKAADVITTNQQNAYGQTIPAAGIASGQAAQSFVGLELTAAPKPAAPPAPTPQPTPPKTTTSSPPPASTPPKTTSSGGGGGGGGTTTVTVDKTQAKLQTFDKDGGRRRGRRSRPLAGPDSSTLVTSGEGVLGNANTSGKTLFGE